MKHINIILKESIRGNDSLIEVESERLNSTFETDNVVIRRTIESLVQQYNTLVDKYKQDVLKDKVPSIMKHRRKVDAK